MSKQIKMIRLLRYTMCGMLGMAAFTHAHSARVGRASEADTPSLLGIIISWELAGSNPQSTIFSVNRKRVGIDDDGLKAVTRELQRQKPTTDIVLILYPVGTVVRRQINERTGRESVIAARPPGSNAAVELYDRELSKRYCEYAERPKTANWTAVFIRDTEKSYHYQVDDHLTDDNGAIAAFMKMLVQRGSLFVVQDRPGWGNAEVDPFWRRALEYLEAERDGYVQTRAVVRVKSDSR